MAKDDPTTLRDEEDMDAMDDQLDSNDQEADDVELKPNEGVDPDDLSVDGERNTSHDENNDFRARPEHQISHESSHEHNLDDLAEEDEKEVPMGVNPSVKKFNLDDNEESFSSSIPPLNSSRSSLYNDSFSSRRSSNAGGRSRLIILALVAILVVGGAVYLLKSRLHQSASSEPTASEQPVESSSPTPSPTPSIDRSKYKIRVLNGTSTSGLAASEAAKLKNLGYQIDKTGNATNSAFTTTEVSVKTGTDNLLNTLISDLSPDYTAASSGITLKDSDTADGEVILGK